MKERGKYLSLIFSFNTNSRVRNFYLKVAFFMFVMKIDSNFAF